MAAYRKAIGRATHFTYVEDQYLWPSTVVDDLKAATARGVHVILVTSRDYDLPPPLSTAHQAMRDETLIRIASGNAANLHVFHLEQSASTSQVYVHAKMMIVDDQYVAVGSANLNFRSHTTDSELHVGIFDTELVNGAMGGSPGRIGLSIRDLRTQLWGEHMNQDPSLFEDPVASLATLPTGGAKIGQLVSSPVPVGVPGADYREILREMLRSLQQMENWQQLATVVLGLLGIPVPAIPGVDLGALADLIPNPEAVVKDVLNPHTRC